MSGGPRPARCPSWFASCIAKGPQEGNNDSPVARAGTFVRRRGGGGSRPRSPQQDPIAKYSAQVVNFDAPVGAATGLVQIQITRWSTDAERDKLTNTLFEQGGKQLLDVVSKLPPVGLRPHARQCRLSPAICATHHGEPRTSRPS